MTNAKPAKHVQKKYFRSNDALPLINTIMKKTLSLLALISIMLLPNCSKKESDTDYPDDVRIKIESVTTLQTNVFQSFENLLSDTDTLSALDSVISFFKENPEVAWTEKNLTGISVQYESGIRGGIYLGSRRDHDGEYFSIDLPRENANKSTGNHKNTQANNYCIPPTLRTSMIAPAYSEFMLAVDTLLELHDAGFARTDFWRPEVELDGDASVEKFVFLENYGVIMLYSHGVAWPSHNNIKEVYLQTGEVVNNATNSRYWRYINEGDIPILHGYKGNLYFIGPEFIRKYNNFKNDSTLIYGGFCFSGLGSWPETMIDIGAAGYWGFDWSVSSSKCDKYEYLLIDELTDITRPKPVTCQSFMDLLNQTGFNSYYDRKYKRNVGIHYYGESNLALWEPDNSVIDFPYTKCEFDISVRANFSTTGSDPYNFIFGRLLNVEGSFSNGFFSGTYEHIAGDEEWHDTLLIQLDLQNQQILSFEAWGSVKEHAEVDFTYTNYAITSTDLPLQMGNDSYASVRGADLEDYIYHISFETIWTETDNSQKSNRLNYLIFDDLSELEIQFSD